ncbi:hypothetical protein SpCBS45565_g02536 [Spizellomyces sp. 'palustris']|nr:hypothetical protein SpCBS45565_g02536 [Spizellomyces sp. 'palustris']
MASQTMVQTRVMPNRAHDYVYDTNHTVAGRKDHVKAMMKAQTHDVLIHPSFTNMFSSLLHHPSAAYSLRTHPLPPHVGQDRRAYNPPNPDVTGANRYQYFKRPIIPYMPSLGTQIVYARRPNMLAQTAGAQHQTRPVTPPTKTVGIQTIYRESEAQTDPYSPEYTTAGTTPPELLALATLTYGAGLPVTQTELEMIERARAKRAWEAALPPVVDQESFEKRLRMMEEMELAEWREREEEIKRIQEARLEILTKVIENRELENEKINNERVHRVWEKKLMERDAALERIQRKRVKALRKLTDKRNKVEPKIHRRDIITDYANYGSAVYAPKPRDGVFYDKPSAAVHVHVDDFEDYHGIQELEESLPPKYLRPDFSIPTKSAVHKRSLSARRDLHMQNQLALMDQRLKERKALSQQEETPLRFAQRIEKPPIRPPTPHIENPSMEDEELDVAAILLQKLIRGRLMQNMMYQGKERRLNLINELRTRQSIRLATSPPRTATTTRISTRPVSAAVARATFDSLLTHPDAPVPQIATAAGDAAAFQALEGGASLAEAVEKALERQDQVVRERSVGSARGGAGEDLVDEADEEIVYTPVEDVQAQIRPTLPMLVETTLQAPYTAATLQYLTDELVRLRESQRISAMVRLALRTRRMREAEESGKRQAEIHRRMIEDEIFRQVMQVHQETVDSFLENVVCGSVERCASLESRRAVREYAERVGEVVWGMERSGVSEEETDRRIVRDLVSSFLIPEVERHTLRNRVKNDQRKYLQAAHAAIHSQLPAIESAAATGSTSEDDNEKRSTSRPASRSASRLASHPTSRPASRPAGQEF